MSAHTKRLSLFCSTSFQKINYTHRSKLLTIFGYSSTRNLRGAQGSRGTVGKGTSRGNKILNKLLENYKVQDNLETEFTAVQKEFQDFYIKHDKLQCEVKSPDTQQFSGSNSKESTQQEPRLDTKPRLPATLEDFHHLLAKKVTPMYKIPYETQLKIKYSRSKKILKDVGLTLKKSTKIHIGSDLLPCAVESTVPSPVTESYRNKDEFSIRHGIDGNPKTVGFFLDSISENPNTLCVNADEIIIIKDSHKALAKDFERYIRQSSLDPCINFDDGGHWRNIIARSNAQDELMAIVTMHPQQLTVEERKMEKEKLKEYFTSLNGDRYNLKSLYFQECNHTRPTGAESPFQLLLGDPYLFEQMNNLKFRISPESFFQTNTLAAEHLMKVIFNLCQTQKDFVLLDICCGTGPISLTFAPHVKKCIGIDVSSQAIEDAKANAELNNIENVEFLAGKCENLLDDVLNKVYGKEFIAVVNPSRSSLGKSAIRALRSCKYLTKILYVSCKPSAAKQNFIDLCKLAGRESYLGKPFHPMIAVPVDLFPHTDHCELAVLFQRL